MIDLRPEISVQFTSYMQITTPVNYICHQLNLISNFQSKNLEIIAKHF